jgi:hypothetical protein
MEHTRWYKTINQSMISPFQTNNPYPIFDKKLMICMGLPSSQSLTLGQDTTMSGLSKAMNGRQDSIPRKDNMNTW